MRYYPIRKPNRLKNYDYNTPGAYFITFCTYNRLKILSTHVGAIHESPVCDNFVYDCPTLQLTQQGKILDRIINNFPERFYILKIEQYVIMPNHVHLIIRIANSDVSRAIRESPLRERSLISKAVGYIKMNVSKEIHRLFGNTRVWQRGFHDHIIRDENDYDRISKYIYENPLHWRDDCFYDG